jgi:hypothetical protein
VLQSALTLSLGFMNNKDLNKNEALAPTVSTPRAASTPFIDKGNVTTDITVEEQKKVETMPILEGIVPQKNGTGFFFKKVQKEIVEQEVLMVEVTELASVHLNFLNCE